jgi:hypothetical protein
MPDEKRSEDDASELELLALITFSPAASSIMADNPPDYCKYIHDATEEANSAEGKKKTIVRSHG